MTRCHMPPPGWACTREGGHSGPCAAIPAEQNDYQAALAILTTAADRLKAVYGNGVAPADTSTGLRLSPIAKESYRFLLLQDKLGLVDIIMHLAVAAGRRDV